ncbi:MAG: JAB domain-containing protein [Bacteroidota bacterium]
MQVSEIKVTYRSKVNLSQAPKISNSEAAFNVAIANWDLNEIELRESFKILLLNRANKVKGIYEVSKGGVTGTVVDPKLVFSVALKTMSTAIILIHNHPSGNLTPSSADIQLTQKLKKGGEILDINVLDHLIITPQLQYTSLADQGLI